MGDDGWPSINDDDRALLTRNISNPEVDKSNMKSFQPSPTPETTSASP
jgi:hypothetical protein